MRKPSAASEALVLSPEAPFPAHGGGALRTASLIHYLAQRGAVDVIVFHEPGRPDPAAAFPPGLVRRVDVIELPHHSKSLPAKACRNLLRAARGIPPLVDRFAGFRLALARRYSLSVVEHMWCAPYIEQLAGVSERVVLDLHNIESVLHAHRAETESWPRSAVQAVFSAAYRRLERRLLPEFDTLLVASQADADRIGRPAIVYPNAIPLTPRPAVPEEEVIAFSGNLDYDPNQTAIRWFAAKIWPVLKLRHPRLVWRLIGKNPPALTDPQVEVTGPVPDAIVELARAKVVVVPVRSGSGTRLKIVEAWAAARAVVSTSRGAEGLPVRPGENILIADAPETFAGAIGQLLADPELRARLGQAGRTTYEAGLTWPAAWEKLDRAEFYSRPATSGNYTG